jgi:RNA polymerase sigma factor (sigma-70 family)
MTWWSARLYDYGRARRRRVKHRAAGGEAALGRLVDPGQPDPAATAREHALSERIAQVVETLSPRERAVWQGRASGKTVAALARELECSDRTVYNLWKKVLRRLKSELADRDRA